MNWLQIVTFVAIAGAYGAYGSRNRHIPRPSKSKSGPSMTLEDQNSFPYEASILDRPPSKADYYASYIVSKSAGPLCSGFHIEQNVVVTAASCVMGKPANDLVVMSVKLMNGSYTSSNSFEVLSVIKVKYNDKYNPTTDEHNIAIMLVSKPNMPVYALIPPEGTALQGRDNSNAFITKFTYDDDKKEFYEVREKAEVSLNLNKCGNTNFRPDVFYCVSRSNNVPYSYGLRDLGAPLIYEAGSKVYLLGVFTGHNFNSYNTNYLYQSAAGNADFLHSFDDYYE